MPSVIQISKLNGSIELPGRGKNVLVDCALRSHLKIIEPVTFIFHLVREKTV